MSACTRVTERATEGPCVYEGCGRYGVRGRHYLPTSHAFVGSVLARCGHEEGEHETAELTGRAACRACAIALVVPDNLNYDAVFHAYTDA